MLMTWYLLHVLKMNIHFHSMLKSWFDNSFIELNAQKTQEMCFGLGRVKGASHPLSQPLMIKRQTVETLSTFKYFGTADDENLTFTNTTYTKRHNNVCFCSGN